MNGDSKEQEASKSDGSNMRVEIGVRAKIPFVGNALEAPTIYVDAIVGATILPETSKFNLVEHRTDAQDDQMKARHVGTLVMPTSQIRNVADFMTSIADKLDQVIAQVEENGSAA